MKLQIILSPRAADDLVAWQRADRRVLRKIRQLVEVISVSPYYGIGRPEQLKHELSGC